MSQKQPQSTSKVSVRSRKKSASTKQHQPIVTVVLPAYNAAKTVARTIAAIPDSVAHIVVVDDHSSDDTVAVVKKINDPRVILEQHSVNLGYGGNQKTCYTLALATKADIIAMVHPDYQYDPSLIPTFAYLLNHFDYDLMLGTRIRSRSEALSSGMPKYKYYSNRALTLFQNLLTGQNLSEWHTGMRVYKRSVLVNIPFRSFSNNFVFDTQVLLAAVAHGYIIGELSIPAKYFADASSISFKRSLEYGLQTVLETVRATVVKKLLA